MKFSQNGHLLVKCYVFHSAIGSESVLLSDIFILFIYFYSIYDYTEIVLFLVILLYACYFCYFLYFYSSFI